MFDSVLEPRVDPTRFYVLSAVASSPAAAAANGAPALRVRPVDLASYIRARPIIVRKGDNEIEFREFARWGEPLEQGIARALREDLLARGAASAVQISGVRATNRPADYEVSIRVQACEGRADGSVVFRAAWEIFAAGEKNRATAGGTFQVSDLKWDAKTEASLVGQLSEAVGGLAAEIGMALPKKN